jgi:hypothetical protein
MKKQDNPYEVLWKLSYFSNRLSNNGISYKSILQKNFVYPLKTCIFAALISLKTCIS